MTDPLDLHAEAEQAARRATRRRWIIQGAISLVVACLSVAVTLAIQGMSDAVGDRDTNASIAQTYSDQLVQAGVEPAVNPDQIKGDAGPKGDKGDTGDTGATGPSVSADDVARAVRSYCQGGRCKGAPGQAGPAVTQDQVADAVRAYCNANGRCRGADGLPGVTGATGAQGEEGDTGEQGPAGPPPTDQQIRDAVASFCADGACRGATGDPGPQGIQGPQGEPGPTCPDGSTATVRNVITMEQPLGEPAVLCLPDAP